MDISEIEEVANIDTEDTVNGIDFITAGDQYLTFCLGLETYAIDILCVREIRGWEVPTPIPDAPSHVKGVINLRGLIVPIIDLRLKFTMGEATYSPTTVVIILSSGSTEPKRTMGFVVDAVSDVLNALENDIKKAPASGGTVAPHYVKGLVNAGDNVVTVLNIEPLQCLDESEYKE